MRRGREGGRDRWGREGGWESEVGGGREGGRKGREKGEGGWAIEAGEGGREGREGGREREREREVDKTWMERRGCHIVPLLAHVDSPHCPRPAAGLFSRKKKFRLISGHFEKFRLLYEKRKVETHIWTL